jgi:hypothetical protein
MQLCVITAVISQHRYDPNNFKTSGIHIYRVDILNISIRLHMLVEVLP